MQTQYDFDSLTDFLNSKQLKFKEGFSAQISGEVDLLKKLVNNDKIFDVMEIGFHAGHSSEIFLNNNSKCKVTSFDIASYSYVKLGKEYIDIKYPKRHQLVLGNSLITVPKYIESNPDTKFDLIFIDGGHSYDVAINDIKNCMKLAHKDTIVVMDDTIINPSFECHWNKGPTQAWNEAIELNLIHETGKEDYCKGRGASWGFYNL